MPSRRLEDVSGRTPRSAHWVVGGRRGLSPCPGRLVGGSAPAGVRASYGPKEAEVLSAAPLRPPEPTEAVVPPPAGPERQRSRQPCPPPPAAPRPGPRALRRPSPPAARQPPARVVENVHEIHRLPPRVAEVERLSEESVPRPLHRRLRSHREQLRELSDGEREQREDLLPTELPHKHLGLPRPLPVHPLVGAYPQHHPAETTRAHVVLPVQRVPEPPPVPADGPSPVLRVDVRRPPGVSGGQVVSGRLQ